MKTIIILKIFFLIAFTNIYGQEYSKKTIEKHLDSLVRLSVNLNDIGSTIDENGKLSNTNKETFWINDNMTSNVLSRKKWYSDNVEHSIFQKIYRKGKINDFIIMSKSEFPNIRFYAFWAMLKNDEIEKAKQVMINEKKISREVYWNSFGCEIEPIQSYELMKRFIDKKIR